MTDYSQLSDFEINKRVFKVLLKLDWYKTRNVGVFDYCNNPADAWPIIIENSIGVIPYKKGLSEAWNTATGLISGTTKDANPLRAAMIVFLTMQDAKHG